MSSENILRQPETSVKVGLCRATIYRLIKNNQFPLPVAISEGCVGWLESELDSWIAERASARKSLPRSKDSLLVGR